jgi:hypothetical protein
VTDQLTNDWGTRGTAPIIQKSHFEFRYKDERSKNHKKDRWLHDERLLLDLSRGRGRSAGGDLDIGAEGLEQMIVTLQSLHHWSIGYQHACT